MSMYCWLLINKIILLILISPTLVGFIVCGGGYNGGTVVNTNQYNTEYPSYGAGSFTAEGASSIVDIGTNDGVGKVIMININ